MTTDEERKMLDDCIRSNQCDKIVEQYWNLVCSVVRKAFALKHAPMVRENLEEVYQDVFVQLFDDNRRRLRLYIDGENRSLARWIVVIANNTTLNYLRKKGFDSLWWQGRKMMLDEHFHQSGNLESEVVNKISINSALQVLTQIERIIFKLYRYGMPSRDIAIIVDSTEASINNRISKIKKKIRQAI